MLFNYCIVYSSLAADTRHVAGVGAGAEGFHPADYSRLSQYPGPEGLYTHPPHGRRCHQGNKLLKMR